MALKDWKKIKTSNKKYYVPGVDKYNDHFWYNSKTKSKLEIQSWDGYINMVWRVIVNGNNELNFNLTFSEARQLAKSYMRKH